MTCRHLKSPSHESQSNHSPYVTSKSLPPLAGTVLWLNYGLIFGEFSCTKVYAFARSCCCFSSFCKTWEISQFSCSFITTGLCVFFSFYSCLRDWGTKKKTIYREERRKSIRNETAKKKETEEKHESFGLRWEWGEFLITLFSALNDNFLLLPPSFFIFLWKAMREKKSLFLFGFFSWAQQNEKK